MHINSVSKTTFDGKIKYGKNLTWQKVEAVNEILDYKINKQSIRERIKKATYDLEVLSRDTKNTVHPSVTFFASFKTLYNPDGYYNGVKIKIKNDVAKNAQVLNDELDYFESMKGSYYYSYNSFGEKICAIFNKLFGIQK